jgi:hypothetical protein
MKILIARMVVGSCLAVALAACADAQTAPAAGVPAAAPSPTAMEVPLAAPTRTSAPLAESTPPVGDAYVERALMVVAAELNLAPEAVTVEGIQPVDWPDTALGCPLRGMAYLQKVTPGYLVTLSAAGAEYTVHMDAGGTAIVCSADGTPLPGSIPILPGERIMDGQPWMPVD